VSRFSTMQLPSGIRLQAGMPKEPGLDPRRAYGLNVRGVVVGLHPRDQPLPGPAPASTYATVLTYGRVRRPLERVLVASPFASLHTGTVGGLRVASVAAGGVFDLDHVDPATLDGSHVIVGFLDDDLGQPFIQSVIEHPRADGGGPITGDVQDRVRLSSADGQPLLIRWNGVTFGVDGAGDFLVDLERAHDGALVGTGQEPPPSVDGSHGNVRVNLPEGSRVVVQIAGGPSLTLEQSGGEARLVLGDGAQSVAVAEPLRALYEALANYIHTQLIVLTAFGPSAPPVAAGAPPPPTWDAAIVSGRAKIPG